MHGTTERLWQFSVLTGKVTDLTWPDHDYLASFSELSVFVDTCEGHRRSDVFPFGLIDEDVTNRNIRTQVTGQERGGNTLTNRELLNAFDPRHSGMTPYIYDNFKWDHCAADGYNFDDIWDQLTS